jgi:quinohemoprotein ethanol dehydrogenase
VLMHAPKNGFFYVLDREDGALISAEKIGKVTWAERIDLATGRPVEIPGARYEDGPALVWPGSGGTHNWHPMAYSPDTGLVYIPARELPGVYDGEGRKAATWQMTPYDVMGLKGFFDDIPKNAGTTSLLAWNPVTQKEAWRNPTPGATAGGVIVTRGGLVFQGLADGRFVATDAKTGAELWSHAMGVGTQAPPLTFEADGRQYVAVLAGWGGAPSLLGSLSAQHGWVGRQYPRRLLAFALDGTAKLPDSPPPVAKVEPVDDPDFVVDAVKAAAGQRVYARQCTICHGSGAVAGGYAPDLRASPVPLSAEAFKAIVHGGALEARGMPRFDEFSDADLEAMRHYLRERARYEPSLLDQLGQLWDFIKLMVRMELAKRGW